jgi:adenosine deaminase
MNRYQTFPKVELHLHLDCSLSYNVVKILIPEISVEVYNNDFVGPIKCNNLVEYIQKAQHAVDIMQTEAQLRLVTLDLFKQLKADNIIYAEFRFAPLQHLKGGLSATQVVEIVNNATEEGIKKYGIEAGVILCTLRHFSEVQSMETVALVHQFKGTRVVGFDIAADEVGYPVANHIKAFQFAQSHQIHCTAHAGEARGAESVWETLEVFKPERIGHGVRSAEDEKLLAYLKEHNIHLEICPSSNVKTNVFKTIENHFADKIYNAGVSMSINTDGRTISNVSLTEEYLLMEKVFKWTTAHFQKCNIEAINHSFASEVVKEKIKEMLNNVYGCS